MVLIFSFQPTMSKMNPESGVVIAREGGGGDKTDHNDNDKARVVNILDEAITAAAADEFDWHEGEQQQQQQQLAVKVIKVEKDKMFSCDQCEALFTAMINLKRHKLKHTGEKCYPCPHCEKTYYRLDSLQKHTRAHTF